DNALALCGGPSLRQLPAPVDDMEWKCLLQSSLGPNMHIKPKVGAAGDIIYFIYSLLLKSGLLTLHVLDV
ncbi:hypothetical protein KY284_003966, partial [Solanum tuberosum]